jgi:hypothetical protein
MTSDPLSNRGYLIAVSLLLIALMAPNTINISDYELPELNYTTPQIFIGQFESPTLPQKALGAKMELYFGGVRMSELLDCLWLQESSRGIQMYGDYYNGKPLAYGHYQIHLWQHPKVSYECAMDYECSTAYVIDEILAGRGWQWTDFNDCLTKN